jgi:DNA-binding NtrC family response regulator
MRVLIADDDPNVRFLLEAYCKKEDFSPIFAEDGLAALSIFEQGDVGVVVTDVHMPKMDGGDLLNELKRLSPLTPVLLMTAHGSVDEAVEYLKQGADDYISKPISREVFVRRVGSFVEKAAMALELERLRSTLSDMHIKPSHTIIGNSPAMRALLGRLPMTAQTDASVVVYGESGTGKELVAVALHDQGKRSGKRFVPVNCGALPDTLLESELFGYKRGAFTDAARDTPGLVEEAEGGTLFLDEIGEISPTVQAKLLRFLQSREYKALGSPKSRKADVRIVTATNRDLKKMVKDGTFREDLYYRLNIVPLLVPPLRDRKSDIPLLATHFLDRFATAHDKPVRGFTPEAMAMLMGHDWPGNVRQLENKIQQVVVLSTGPMISAVDLDLHDDPALPLRAEAATSFKEEKRRLLDGFERDYVRKLLDLAEGNLSEAARQAGMDRKNFWTLAKKHGLVSKRRRPLSAAAEVA